MPKLLTMAKLVQRCQQRCDKENDPQIDSSVGGEWYGLVSEQYGELYELVAATGMRYFDAAQSFTTTGSSNALAQPSDHMETIGLDHIINPSTGQRRALIELMAQERARWSGMTGDALAFELVAASFLLYPFPPAGQTYELRYVPQAPDLTTKLANDTVDLLSNAGAAFVIWGVAIKAGFKSESDLSVAMAERQRYHDQVVDWAVQRSLNEPRRAVVRDNTADIEATALDGGDPAGWWNRP